MKGGEDSNIIKSHVVNNFYKNMLYIIETWKNTVLLLNQKAAERLDEKQIISMLDNSDTYIDCILDNSVESFQNLKLSVFCYKITNFMINIQNLSVSNILRLQSRFIIITVPDKTSRKSGNWYNFNDQMKPYSKILMHIYVNRSSVPRHRVVGGTLYAWAQVTILCINETTYNRTGIFTNIVYVPQIL